MDGKEWTVVSSQSNISVHGKVISANKALEPMLSHTENLGVVVFVSLLE